MKRSRIIILGIIAAFIISLSFYIGIRKDYLVYMYMLYHHIQYNGNDYYRLSYDSPSKNGEKRGPVYLVNKSSKIMSKDIYDAYVFTGYEGEEEEIYLYFDSGTWIREGYSTATD